MSRHRSSTKLALVAAALALLASACVDVSSDDRTVIVAPSPDSFPPVGLFLVHRCGSLDCHGQPGRNMRLYGQEGQRLAPDAVPGAGPTTMAELDADYRSVVALEPEIMSEVVKDHGQDPERLTLIRKARGEEAHTGGALVKVGDAQDLCLTSWLAGSTDQASCAKALKTP